MRQISSFIFIFITGLILSACFHKAEEPNLGAMDLALFHPELPSHGTYAELLGAPQLEISTIEDAQDISGKIVLRLLNHMAIYSDEVDLLASSGIGTIGLAPAFKPKGKPRILYANTCVAEGDSEELDASEVDVKNLENLTSVFLDDKDNSGTVSEGDGWIQLISHCEESDLSNTTGTLYFSNFAHQQDALTGVDAPIAELKVDAHFESQYVNTFPLSIMFEHFSAIFNRSYDANDFVTSSFVVVPGAHSMATRTASEESIQQYVLFYEDASVTYVESADDEFEYINFKGKYYDSDLDAHIVVDDLQMTFDYAYDNNLGALTELSMTLNSEAVTVSFADSMITITMGSESVELSISEFLGAEYQSIVPMD
ncbi:MAG: hypothetical protein OEZ43_03020 [Gammaproteobacteria bacterium]|nr:hypothetical protein [Gammaproteobacteria bacterium]